MIQHPTIAAALADQRRAAFMAEAETARLARATRTARDGGNGSATGPRAGSHRAATPATRPPAGAWPACVPPAPAEALRSYHGCGFSLSVPGRRNGGIVMAAGLAPNNIRALPTGVHTEDLDPMKPGVDQQFWYTVLGLGLAVGAFFAAWGLHGSASSTYRIDNQWSAG